MSEEQLIRPGYGAVRADILDRMTTCQEVLDLGCSDGRLGAEIRRRFGARVTGVEVDATAAAGAQARLDRVICQSIGSPEYCAELGAVRFDTVICGDVLEHLVDPEGELAYLVGHNVSPDARFIVSVPNVAHWSTAYAVWRRKSWPRRERGIHDASHLRWFTAHDLVQMLEGAGLEVVELTRKFRLVDEIDHPLNHGALQRLLARLVPDLITHQLLAVGKVANRGRSSTMSGEPETSRSRAVTGASEASTP